MKALVVCAGGGVGDVLLATPVMRALRGRYDEVVALTTPAHAPVLDGNPDLAQVWSSEGGVATLARRIAGARFDAAVVTWATLRSALLPALAHIPVRVGQARRLYSPLFTRRVVVRSERGDRTTHWTQILLDFARAIECDVADASPVFVLDEAARRAAADVLAAAGLAEPFVLLHPTRGITAQRRWPTEGLGRLGQALRARLGGAVVVTGSAVDRAVAGDIASRCGGISLAGETSLPVFAAIAARARCVVAMDSGPMHLAAAVGAPTVGIFALQSDEPDRWAPLGPRTATVRADYPCPPQHRKETCPDFACVRELDVAAIVAAAQRLLLAPDSHAHESKAPRRATDCV
ncbi:MAG TPA: glycosyltransferase family 9 protein [Candidatus Acidoferrales bacterium]|nr:glycosyltransferase family 9 protein [Candidatus Acidoferrales bacterium]